MFLVPKSPRRRRRLLWFSLVAIAAAATAAVVLLLPKGEAIPKTSSNEPAQVAEPSRTRLSATDRRGINATLDRFLVAALDRRDPAGAWALAGPGLRGGSTRADWEAGRMPIPVYPLEGAHFGTWSQLTVNRDSVSFDLIVQPRAGSKRGALGLTVQMIRRARDWVVNGLYQAATFTPAGQQAHVVGPYDFAAAGRGESDASDGTLSGVWIAAPVGLFLLGLLAVGVVVGRNWLRYRRARKTFASGTAKTMPSLPDSVRRSAGRRPLE